MFKKISAVGVSCVTALVLMLSSIISSSNASAVSLEEMTNAAIDCIISHEGSYSSINPNDCGAVSVGKLQWHADRALNVMRRACEINPTFAAATLGSSLYNEVMSATNWNYRTFSSSEASAAAALLGSECGIAAQDAQASSDVQGYIISGQNMGLTDAGALVLYADIYNFGCGIAARVAQRAASYAGSYSAVTLDDMYKATLNDGYSSNSAFVDRANMVYNHLCQLDFGGAAATTDITTTTTPAIQFTEDGAGTYTVIASSLNMRSGPGTDYSIVTTIKSGSSVTVTSTGGGWAVVSYGGYEGYCSMEYLSLAQNTEPSETTAAAEVTTTAATEEATETTTTETTIIETTTTASETEETTTETETTTSTTEMTFETTETTSTEVTTEVSETTTTATELNEVIVNSAYASIYGDVNGDGAVTVADAVLLHKYLVGAVSLNVEQLANADCSCDSLLSLKDVTVIMQHLSGRLTALPIL
ncbi:MAG: SH3 domain-containing protein [Ruminococcus sp.]|nr:SH3 domain-containing protein [Ruminococcus sp.]